MMAKFWWSVVRSDVQRKSHYETDELLKPGEQPRVLSAVALRSSPELNFLEPFKEFTITHDKKREFYSCNYFYEISNHCSQLLFKGVQEYRCCWFKDPYEKLQLFDANDKPTLEIFKTEFSGYLSTKMRFSISSTSGSKLGEVVRISEFMEMPKYEINDHHGDLLFLMSVGCTDGSRGNINHFITGKMGKMAHILEDNSIIGFKIHQPTSVTEKALLLSLVLLLDMAKRAG